jgi:hypothetical protein
MKHVPGESCVQSDEARELRLLQRASLMNQWRWRAEEKRLRRRGEADPFGVHHGEIMMMNTVWTELRREAGLPPGRPPAAVWRIAVRLYTRKCRQYLRENA